MRTMPFQTLLETTGRKSGEPRRTPLGGSKVGNEFWFVSEFGEKSQYVRNIKANPNVRVRLRGRWHSGTAHLVPDDDPQARLRELPQFNSFGVRTFGTNLLTRPGRPDRLRRSTRAPHRKSKVRFQFLLPSALTVDGATMESFVHLRKGKTPRRLHADLDGLKDDELGRGGFTGRTANMYRRNDPTAYRSRARCDPSTCWPASSSPATPPTPQAARC